MACCTNPTIIDTKLVVRPVLLMGYDELLLTLMLWTDSMMTHWDGISLHLLSH